MSAPSEKSRGRLLVVDDHRASRELLRRVLEEERFEVFAVESGEKALEEARRLAPEVILLDIMMPGLDGIETCRRLKAGTDTALIPVLFVTGHGEEDIAVRGLEAGANDLVSKDASPAVLVARVLCQLAIFRSHQRLQQLAATDELTGVSSRRFMFDALRRTLKLASRYNGGRLSCLLVDIDHFKRINDERGHLDGDRVLREVAGLLRSLIRQTDLVARLGGDEFLVVLHETDNTGAQHVAEKLRDQVAQACGVTVSVGIASLTPAQAATVTSESAVDDAVQALIQRADVAMYRAKERGRNRVEADGTYGGTVEGARV